MERKVVSLIAFVLAVAFALSVVLNFAQYRKLKEKVVEVKTDTICVVEFVQWKDTLPNETRKSVVGTIKVAVGSADGVLTLPSDTADENFVAVDSIDIEITQKVYSDSTYTAYVSGYLPKLDSIFVRERIVRETISKTIKDKELRRWNLGLVGGYGYGMSSKTFEPFIGIGVTVNLIK